MSCRNYIGYKLQLPVACSASDGVFPGCFFNPETNNDSTGQSTIQYCVFSFLPKSFLCFILDFGFFLNAVSPPYHSSFTSPTMCLLLLTELCLQIIVHDILDGL